jgi:hypothetical protein
VYRDGRFEGFYFFYLLEEQKDTYCVGPFSKATGSLSMFLKMEAGTASEALPVF